MIKLHCELTQQYKMVVENYFCVQDSYALPKMNVWRMYPKWMGGRFHHTGACQCCYIRHPILLYKVCN
jgi:hypothetical protein